MAGKGQQPPPAVQPRHPMPHLPGVVRGGPYAAGQTATVVPPPPNNHSSKQHAPPPATILHQMFSTCVARGIAAKLVYKTVGGVVETSLFCSAPSTAAAASSSSKQGRKRPDNERRRLRRNAWLQRRNSSKPGMGTAASTATAPGEEVVLSSAAVAATAVRSRALVQSAAHGAAAVATEAAAATPPQAWAWEPRNRLLVVARRVLESPEIVRESEVIGDLNLSVCSLMEDQEAEVAPLMDTADFSKKPTSSPTYAAAAAGQTADGDKAVSGAEAPATAAPAMEEEHEDAAQPAYRPPPTPPPWSRHFSSHPARVLCTYCFAGNRETRNSRCSDCFRAQREAQKK